MPVCVNEIQPSVTKSDGRTIQWHESFLLKLAVNKTAIYKHNNNNIDIAGFF